MVAKAAQRGVHNVAFGRTVPLVEPRNKTRIASIFCPNKASGEAGKAKVSKRPQSAMTRSEHSKNKGVGEDKRQMVSRFFFIVLL